MSCRTAGVIPISDTPTRAWFSDVISGATRIVLLATRGTPDVFFQPSRCYQSSVGTVPFNLLAVFFDFSCQRRRHSQPLPHTPRHPLCCSDSDSDLSHCLPCLHRPVGRFCHPCGTRFPTSYVPSDSRATFDATTARLAELQRLFSNTDDVKSSLLYRLTTFTASIGVPAGLRFVEPEHVTRLFVSPDATARTIVHRHCCPGPAHPEPWKHGPTG